MVNIAPTIIIDLALQGCENSTELTTLERIIVGVVSKSFNIIDTLGDLCIFTPTECTKIHDVFSSNNYKNSSFREYVNNVVKSSIANYNLGRYIYTPNVLEHCAQTILLATIHNMPYLFGNISNRSPCGVYGAILDNDLRVYTSLDENGTEAVLESLIRYAKNNERKTTKVV